MPLAQSSTDARRCQSTVALCADHSICSRDTLPRDATSLSSMLLEGPGLPEDARAFSLQDTWFLICPLRDMGLLQACFLCPSSPPL